MPTLSKGYTGANKDELDHLWGGGEAVENIRNLFLFFSLPGGVHSVQGVYRRV